MRQPLIAGNFKMFKTVGETVSYVGDLRALLKDTSGIDIVIAPPFTALAGAATAAEGKIGIAAQDMHWERERAFTGAVSAAMVHAAGARWVISGHSERRALFGATNISVNKSSRAAITGGLVPIVCIGETLAQRDSNDTLAVLDR